ncbi:energy transducer TonB [Henriciella sp. AS95]|uniref:energy transducer TonB n=1 Tax=Henriciella sp. AS95 TaxID=3135782 RepID=UPI00316C00F0
MRISTITAMAAGLGLVAACAVDPVSPVYVPNPAGTGATASSPATDLMIAECGHAGADLASIVFPDGWQMRLAEVATKSASNDELLGGPVTTEVVDRNAKPISPPVPTYPSNAAMTGREGVCEVMFDVNKSGAPEEILTACSSPEFNASAFNAVSSVRFGPKVVDGRNVRRLNVVYPLQYCLGG